MIDQGLQTVSKPGGTAAVPIFSFGAVFGNDSGHTFNDDGFLYSQPILQAQAGTIYSYLYNGSGTNVTTFAGRNSTHVSAQRTNNVNAAQTNDHIMWKNTFVARGGNVGATEIAYPWLPCATYSPALWPDFQPCTLSGEVDDFEVDSIIGKTKVSEYMKYLANVRSLPIGVSGVISGSTYAASSAAPMAAATTTTVNAPNCSFTEYRVSMPFLSGIYGILADKMFPDLLIGANNIRIEFKLASNNKALWLTMDPCRRVPGTVRDFAPFTGASNGSRRFGQSQSLFGFLSSSLDSAGTALFPSGAALGCTSAMLYSGFTAISTGLTQNLTSIAYSATNSGAIIAGSYIYNTVSAMGEDLVAAQPLIDYTQGSSFISNNALTFTINTVGIMTVTGITDPTVLIEPGNQIAVDFTGGLVQFVWVTITGQTTLALGDTYGGTGSYFTNVSNETSGGPQTNNMFIFANAYSSHANPTSRSGYSLSNESNLPKPQYIPTATPWSQKAVGTLAAPTLASYCNENAACYGTYLPASVAQTRRCQVSSRLAIVDANFSANGATAFAIRDLQYIGEQVQLDDISTSAIIQHAATSEIVVWTRGYRSFEANCDTGTQQNIILPIQVRGFDPASHDLQPPLLLRKTLTLFI